MMVAQSVCQKIPPTSLFHEPVNRFANLFLYGAVAPDTCFYYVLGPHSDVVQQSGQIFHTPNSSSLLPVLEFIKRFPRKDPDVLAFAAGLCCHIMTDTLFHPMVYYFAGLDDVHKGATTRHRMFETALDLQFLSMAPKGAAVSLLHVLKNLEVPDTQVTHFLENLFYPGNEACQKYLFYALKSHHLANRLFLNLSLYKILEVLSGFKLGFLEKYTALFYPFDKPIKFKFFDQPVNYKDPVTGEAYSQSVEQLSQTAVEKIILLLSVIEAGLSGKKDLDDVLLNPDLPKIRPCPPQQSQTFKYWNGKSNLRQIVYRDIVF